LNADEVEVVESPERVLFFNLYTYCVNDPINEVDETGGLIASTIAKVILGAVCGLLIQLVNDIIGYLIDRAFDKNKYTFNPQMWNYVSSAIDYALDTLNPFGKKSKAFVVILGLLPMVIKHVWRWIAGKDFSLSDLIWDATWSIVSAITSYSLSQKKKNDLNKLKNYYKTRNADYKLQHLKLKANFKALGRKWELSIDIAAWIIDRVLKATKVF
jgi:hypothetical protein